MMKVPIQIQQIDSKTLLCLYKDGSQENLHNSPMFSQSTKEKYDYCVENYGHLIEESVLPTLAMAQKNCIDAMIAEVERALAPLSDQYPRSEIDSWPVQTQEAKAYLLDKAAPTPMVDTILAQGENKQRFCETLVAKATAYSEQVGPVIRWRRAVSQFIEFASAEELAHYTPQFPTVPGGNDD
ncbi:hypothetical protein QF117_10665 [Vibrio sp. YMD68]|uniref:hypothetical protein n=1 Tax=Vibrio sp. YMD68 TaxID=3042300 RepID=UPI00249B341B|nr:hypothetical protein [Vibrio sp. YMD68]WGV98821.1 hypothetical protein QF117_02345 [Vibrio sp. YMD68]WGW01252.1 hypothetical protein QF117_10665 [Vibrio sp. YMD68]